MLIHTRGCFNRIQENINQINSYSAASGSRPIQPFFPHRFKQLPIPPCDSPPPPCYIGSSDMLSSTVSKPTPDFRASRSNCDISSEIHSHGCVTLPPGGFRISRNTRTIKTHEQFQVTVANMRRITGTSTRSISSGIRTPSP